MKSKIISVVNQKGGVGKTTSSINFARALTLNNNKVLIIDLDPQGNCSTGLGIEKNVFQSANIYHCLLGLKNINECVYKTSMMNLDLLPSDINLSATELDLINEMARETRLKSAINNLSTEYDFIIIDCPPSLSLLTINALNSSHYYIIPMLPEMYSLEGFDHIQKTIMKVQQFLGNPIECLGVLFTMVDKRNNLHREMSNFLREKIKINIFKTEVPRNIALAEAVNFGTSIFDYKKSSIGAESYSQLANEVLNILTLNKENKDE